MERTTASDDAGPEQTTAERFEAFHQHNPHVYEELVRLCRIYARATGGRRFGLRQPWERMRWDLAMRTAHPDGDPKLDDRYIAFYSRLIGCQEPDLAGVFETRRAPEADRWAASLPCWQPETGGAA